METSSTAAPTAAPSASWYVAKNGQQTGPFNWPELVSQSANGRLAPDDLIWCEGMGDWVPARGQPGLAFTETMSAVPYAGPMLSYAPQQFDLPYAGFWRRFGAHMIDWLLLSAVGFVLGFIVGFAAAAGGGHNADLGANLIVQVLNLVIGWLYTALMLASPRRATLGKMAMGITVVGPDGGQISFGRATGRHFAEIISGLILGIGYLMMLWTERKQTLHDMMASTYVLHKPR